MYRYVYTLLVLFYVVRNGSTKPFLFSNPLAGAPAVSTTHEPEESKYIEKIPPKHEQQVEYPDNEEVYPNEISTNSEAPNLIQLKIQKILRNIVTLSQIHNAVQGGYDDSDNENNFKYDNLEDLGESESDDFIGDDEQYNPNISQYARYYPRNANIKPLRLEVSTSANDEMTTEAPGNDNNSIGYFILESLASLVGLTVGAFTHVQFLLTHNKTAT